MNWANRGCHVLRELSRRLFERSPGGRVVLSLQTPAGWKLVVWRRGPRFDSALAHPNGRDVAASYWNDTADQAVEFAVTYLEARDPTQGRVLREMVREAAARKP